MANRLASEQSPYLLQHKDNPVDWYPWGQEAFDRARRENKPIFLSVGYSTCHWCHVMEHESFEDAAIAEVLSRYFVSIKVDREERPDVDRVYMTFVQMTTGSGGWPMSVWLTPALEPFYGGTYFPPTARWGRPGFVEVLEEIARIWRDEHGRVEQSAGTIVERLRSVRGPRGGGSVPGTEALDRNVGEFASSFDHRRGGFGGAPKFPRPSELLFLLREHARTKETEPRDMVLGTLSAMALGGMRDHLGGGFHRYSVDADWRVPHFEKMLYDQAQLVLAYGEAAQVTGDRFFADVALDTLEYVRRDLTSPEGGFFSAEDADSVPPEHAHEARPHKMEGAFYIWRDDEIEEVLGKDADLFRVRFGVRPDGNAPSDPQGEFTRKNLLFVSRSLEEAASLAGRSPGEAEEALRRARAALMARRATRPRPHLDDKILTAWNGLMIAAFARAARVMDGAESCLVEARRAAAFLREHSWNASSGTLLRRVRQGEAGIEAYAEDYACLVFGLLELFQAGADPAWLEWAIALQRRQDELFWDPIEGGWFSTTGRDESVLLRLKEDYDGAEPSASSVGLLNLLTLTHLVGDSPSTPNTPTPNSQWSARIEQTFRAFGTRLAESGRAAPMMLAALSTYHAGVHQVVIVGERDAADTRALEDVVRRRYMPSAVVMAVAPSDVQRVSVLLPWISSMKARDGRATAYVCRNFACEAPTTDADVLGQLLDGN
ncbi:MAG TPA: thioredoxin domain-containing protein [Vicinamibacterales bacterium]|nr:thioredoxin domain-containing protein [Vicinamibacterales bacterium]